MTRKKYLLLPGTALVAALLLMQQEHPVKETGSVTPGPAAVWEDGPDGGGEAEKIERLSVSVSLSSMEFVLLEQQSRRWSSRYPGLEIDLHNHPPSPIAVEEWRRKAVLGEAGDIALLPSQEIIPLAASGVLHPLDKLKGGGAGFGGSGAFWEKLYWNGYLWGVPLDGDPDVLIYNEAKLRKSGLFRAPESWEQLQGLSAAQPGTAAVLVGRDDAAGAAAWTASWAPEAAAAELPERLLQALNGWGAGSSAIQAYDTASQGQARMEQGEALSILLPWSKYKRWNPGSGFLVDYGLPLDADDMRMRSYAVTSSSSNRDAAAAWIAAMTDPEAQQTFAESSLRLIPLPSLYDGGEHGYPAGWKPLLFQSPPKKGNGYGGSQLEPLWHSYWAAPGSRAPEELAASWAEAIKKSPPAKEG